jgi:acetyl-CoA synthetase
VDHQPIVWRLPEADAASTVTGRFMTEHGIDGYEQLVNRSVAEPEWFWDAVVKFLGIPFAAPYHAVRDSSEGVPWTTWFVGGTCNLSTACVDRWAVENPDANALLAATEAGGDPRRVTFGELLTMVERVAGAFAALGVGMGDAVGCFLPMSVEAVVTLLASARIGAMFIPIFSGFGADAVAARLVDPSPALLVTADGYHRRGRLVEMKETADEAVAAAGGVPAVLVVSHSGRTDTPMTEGRDHLWDEAVSVAAPLGAKQVDSEHPVMLAYTSGTTGKPKGAVHVHGGLTVKLAQEGAFHFDVQRGDALLWATDMGWIMGPWSIVAALGNGAAVGVYDGAPDHPDPGRLWRLVGELGLTHLGVSPTLIRALMAHGDEHAAGHDFDRLRVLGSTGEPWNPDPWWWLYRTVGGERIPIVNISGGTEVGAVIVGVNLHQGLKPTSLGGPALGMAAEVYDADGRPVRGAVGELVIEDAWPAMTRGFWSEPDRYLATYWDRWEGVWAHGDWASVDEDGFWFLHGRSDDTLNIAGKRIGPAEVESVVVSLPEIVMAAAVGIPDLVKGEVVVVYAVPRPDAEPDGELAERVSDRIAATLGKAFRPAAVRFVPDLPRTRSAKIMRRVVKALVVGSDAGDLSSLENPESLEAIRPG